MSEYDAKDDHAMSESDTNELSHIDDSYNNVNVYPHQKRGISEDIHHTITKRAASQTQHFHDFGNLEEEWYDYSDYYQTNHFNDFDPSGKSENHRSSFSDENEKETIESYFDDCERSERLNHLHIGNNYLGIGKVSLTSHKWCSKISNLEYVSRQEYLWVVVKDLTASNGRKATLNISAQSLPTGQPWLFPWFTFSFSLSLSASLSFSLYLAFPFILGGYFISHLWLFSYSIFLCNCFGVGVRAYFTNLSSFPREHIFVGF